MASRLNLELKVGIFAFIALIILALAVFSISEIYIFSPGYNVKVTFGFASGLNVGALVRVAGIEVGEVKDIELSYDKTRGKAQITLQVWLKQGVEVPKDSLAYVNMLGLIGENYLEIIPGQDYSNPLKPGEALAGRDPLSTETLMEVAHKVAGDLDEVLVSINNILDPETENALRETATNLRDASENINIITERLERGEGKLGAWLKAKKRSKRKTRAKEKQEEEKKIQPKQNF